jgi:hypothetical protein
MIVMRQPLSCNLCLSLLLLFCFLTSFFEADGLSSSGIKGRLDGDSNNVWIHKEILRKGFDTKDAVPLSNI